jgi:hypothetical protein
VPWPAARMLKGRSNTPRLSLRHVTPHTAAVLTATAAAAIAENTFAMFLDPERESNQHFARQEGSLIGVFTSSCKVRGIAFLLCDEVSVLLGARHILFIFGCVEAQVPDTDRQRACHGHFKVLQGLHPGRLKPDRSSHTWFLEASTRDTHRARIWCALAVSGLVILTDCIRLLSGVAVRMSLS